MADGHTETKWQPKKKKKKRKVTSSETGHLSSYLCTPNGSQQQRRWCQTGRSSTGCWMCCSAAVGLSYLYEKEALSKKKEEMCTLDFEVDACTQHMWALGLRASYRDRDEGKDFVLVETTSTGCRRLIASKEDGDILVTSVQMDHHSWTPRGRCPQQLAAFSDPYIIASERRNMKPFLNHLQALRPLHIPHCPARWQLWCGAEIMCAQQLRQVTALPLSPGFNEVMDWVTCKEQHFHQCTSEKIQQWNSLGGLIFSFYQHSEITWLLHLCVPGCVMR